MNLLEVRNICKTYGSGETSVKALKDVSFSVPRGEYVAVVGESGSGKSTLLNMIGALDIPTSGKDVYKRQLLICHEPEFYQDVVNQVWDMSKWTTKVL